MSTGPPRSAPHGNVTTAVPSTASARTQQDLSEFLHEASFAFIAQALSGCVIQAAPERTDQHFYRDALKRDRPIAHRDERSTPLPPSTKDGDSSSDNTAPPCSKW